jgi:hypothetical protein
MKVRRCPKKGWAGIATRQTSLNALLICASPTTLHRTTIGWARIVTMGLQALLRKACHFPHLRFAVSRCRLNEFVGTLSAPD